jgi:hypothetical protein
MVNDSNNKTISDPKVFGPGIWYIQHIRAKNATTDQLKKDFINEISFMCANLPCLQCKGHCLDYLKANPVEKFLNINEDGVDIGMFKWMWAFHNAVNLRLNKPVLDWKTAKNMYYTSEVCSLDCGEQPVANEDKIKLSKNVRIVKNVDPTNILHKKY